MRKNASNLSAELLEEIKVFDDNLVQIALLESGTNEDLYSPKMFAESAPHKFAHSNSSDQKLDVVEPQKLSSSGESKKADNDRFWIF